MLIFLLGTTFHGVFSGENFGGSQYHLEPSGHSVKNVIILMGDGFSAGHVATTRWYKGSNLALDEMFCGAIRTYTAESIVTDSAPAATAFACGYKTSDKFLGILPDTVTIPYVDKPSEEERMKPIASVLEGARFVGKSTGLVATSQIQHASPAGFSAHWPDRGNYNEICEQMVYQNLDVVFGGGKKYLLPESKKGTRTDGEDMLQILKEKGYDFIETRDELIAQKKPKVWGMFADNDMSYEMDRQTFHPEQPSLAEMTEKAIELLSKNKKGFFLFVEGSKIDWASHANDPIGVISDMLAYDDAVRVALDFAAKDKRTLVMGFADHGNGGMTIGSTATDATYSKMEPEELLASLKKAKLTGEGIQLMLGDERTPEKIKEVVEKYYGIANLSEEEIAQIQNSKQELNYELGPMMSKRAHIGWTTFGHTGEDLFLFAYGPNRPVGMIDNTEVAYITAESLGFELPYIDQLLFNEAESFAEKIGATLTIDKTDEKNLTLVLSKGEMLVKLPISKDLLIWNDKTYQLNGLTVLAPKTNRVYITQSAIDLVADIFEE
ncbi:alkaline phosphatase [bacterium]|nr:alkaline phosphatase [bacterium]